MKSKQLLSIVFSLIMFTGVTAGSVAFAQTDDVIDSFDDCVEAGGVIGDNPNECTLDDMIFVNDEDDDIIDDFEDCVEAGGVIRDNLNECTLDDMVFVNDEDDDIIEDFEDCVEAGNPVMESYPEQCMTADGIVFVNIDDDDDDDHEKVFVCHKDKKTLSIGADALTAHLDHGDTEGHCEGDTRVDYMHDKDMRQMVDRYCDMSDEDKRAFLAEHDKAAEHIEKMNEYCSLDDDAREDFAKDLMRDKMTDKKHMNYDRLCDMAASDRALEITDVAKLDRISKWCEMTPEEREDYKRDYMKDKKHDKMKYSDQSPRLKAMIMDKHDISDERMDEIKMKFKEKHGDLTDAKKSELKMKFKNHMAKVKANLTDEQKSDIHDRIAEMKAFKADLRERASDITDEEKQELRTEFIEKAKDMRHAWISPRTQMTAGVDAAEVECREGYSLVMKASNGVAMCLYSDTALKMIDRGTVVPAN